MAVKVVMYSDLKSIAIDDLRETMRHVIKAVAYRIADSFDEDPEHWVDIPDETSELNEDVVASDEHGRMQVWEKYKGVAWDVIDELYAKPPLNVGFSGIAAAKRIKEHDEALMHGVDSADNGSV